jgi:hypothetical protein
MVEVFGAPLPDYPNFGVWHENPRLWLEATGREVSRFGN